MDTPEIKPEAKLTIRWLDVNYARLEAQAAAAAELAIMMPFVRTLEYLLWLRLGTVITWLHDEMIIELPAGSSPTGRTNREPPPLYDFNRNGKPREIKLRDE